MEKLKGIRKGRIWLNLFKADDGELIATVNKTYMNKEGKWNYTPFLHPRRGDIEDLRDCISEFHEFAKSFKI
ncbi:hypothetical protein TRIP_B350103 [uncultured Desulfatiglans sp.]|nr:hypothetical protein TRIP_B350103 [uncultured Desulfatiglans sp.]